MNNRKANILSVGGAVLLPVVLGGAAPTAIAAELWYEAGPVDKSEWECKYCPFDTGLEGTISGGLGYVSRDDFQFGNYNGYEDGAFPVLDANLRSRDEDGTYWRFDAARVGIDSRRLSYERGLPGTYTFTFDYVEIPRLVSDRGQTPYRGVDGEVLTLPAGWTRADTTAGMTALAQSLRPLTLRTDRKRLGAGVEFTPGSRWTYSADYRHETKEGLRRIGGPLLFRTAILPQPIDYVHDQVDLAAAYEAEQWNMRVGYNGGFFDNANTALRWEDPFTENIGNATEGRMALAPDNQFHQISLAGSYRFSQKTQAHARLTSALMTQDETFVPATVNAGLSPAALPRDSLDGEVRVSTMDAQIVSAVSDRLTLRGELGYTERDNNTPVDDYSHVATDVVVNGLRTNRPYSYRNSDLGVSARYRMESGMRLAAGADYSERDRTNREVDETQESVFWGELRNRLTSRTAFDLRVARSDRNGTDYEQLISTQPDQNPLLRKYTMSDREQSRADARLSYMPWERMDLGFGVSWSDSDYPGTRIGLRSSNSMAATVDVSTMLGESTTVHGFLTHERYENDQANSESFTTPDWFATTEDAINTFGVGGSWLTMDEALELGVDYVYSRAEGATSYRGETDLPDLTNSLHSVELSAAYSVSNTWTTELSYLYERFRSDDWMLEDVAPDTIPEVLTTGIGEREYENSVIAIYAKYRFGASMF